MAQERFWKELHNLKFDVIFVQALLREAERNERSFKLLFAITSSASIGAWVVWKELAWLWGAIIAGSQVLSAIYPHLPYADRLKTFLLVHRDFEKLFIEAEYKWQAVANGSLSVSDIDDERMKLQKKKSEILNKHMPNSIFPTSRRKEEQAKREAANYFAHYYPPIED
jgi:hypothetical protein